MKLFGNVLELDCRQLPFFVFDFTKSNRELNGINFVNAAEFDLYIKRKIHENNAYFGIGRYNEDRIIYSSRLFTSNARTIHLGIDLWAEAGIRVTAPLKGIIHSFKNNDNLLDYGPTIILKHVMNGTAFYTLYGHLSLDSLEGLKIGQKFESGDVIARIGNYPGNGNYPPHLHFQIISDMLGFIGDFPGVASIAERKKYLVLCPNPNLILQLKGL